MANRVSVSSYCSFYECFDTEIFNRDTEANQFFNLDLRVRRLDGMSIDRDKNCCP